MDLFGLFILTIVPTGACAIPCLFIVPICLPWKSLSGVVPRPWEKLLYRFLFSEVFGSWSYWNLFTLWWSTPESCYVTFSPDLDLDRPCILLSGESLFAKFGLELSLSSEFSSSGCRYFFRFSNVYSFLGSFLFPFCPIIYGYATGRGNSFRDFCSGVCSSGKLEFRAAAPLRYFCAILLLWAKLRGKGKPGPDGLLLEPKVLLLRSDFDLESARFWIFFL